MGLARESPSGRHLGGLLRAGWSSHANSRLASHARRLPCRPRVRCCCIAGAGSVHDATALNETRTLSFHHTHSGEDLTVTFKRNGRYDEAALKKLNHFLRDWRSQDQTDDGSSPVRHPLGSLPRRRRQAADPDHLRLPLPRHQRHAPPPLLRRGAPQPAHAGPGDGLLHSRRAAANRSAPPVCACSAAASASIRPPARPSSISTPAASGTGRA